MESARKIEEMSSMKIRLLGLAFGFFLVAGTAYAGPTPGGADTDGDTVENAFDNCTAVSNSTQTDTDHNGCGNTCTVCNFDTTNALAGGNDFLLIGMNFGMAVPPGTLGDCNGDGLVGGPDFLVFGPQFGMSTGPSGITNAQCNPLTCLCTPQ
jgi:hypothetical protein